MPPISKTNVFVLVAVIRGILIRSIQFFAAPSFWVDELFSVINIQNMSLLELITEQPITRLQVLGWNNGYVTFLNHYDFSKN